MNRFDKFALAAMSVVMLVSGRHVVESNSYYMGQIPEGKLPIGVAGWAIATFGPLAIAVWLWRLAKWVSASWVLHLLFLPCALILFRIGESLMLSVIQDPDFDATLGGPVLPALLLFAVAVGGYFAALIWKQIAAPSKPTNVP